MANTKQIRFGYGLRVKILSFMIPLLSLVALALVSYFLFNSSRLLTQNEIKRIDSLAWNLAYTSELGVAAEDAEFLWLPLNSVLQDGSVKSVAVYNRRGEIIAGLPSRHVPRSLSARQLQDLILFKKDYEKRQFVPGEEIIVPVYFHSAKDNQDTDFLDIEEELFVDMARTREDDQEHTTLTGSKGKDVKGYARVTYSLKAIEAKRNRFLISGLVISLTILFAGVLISLFFSRKITSPLMKLTQAVEDVGKGNLDLEIDVVSRDELGTLSQEFNKMIVSLREARERIDDYQKTLEERVE